MKITLAQVNKEIAKLGEERLFKGVGYFYWAEGNAYDWNSVYVYRVEELTIDRWIEEYKSNLGNVCNKTVKSGRTS